MSMQQTSPQSTSGTFADRIRLLIQRVGSATEIARMCGFSEGVVRSWRDGNTDPSRARCVTLARTLGISLVWLVAGEGAIQVDPTLNAQDDQYTSEVVRSHHRPRAKLGTITQLPLTAHANGLDPQRLNTAMQMILVAMTLALAGFGLQSDAAKLALIWIVAATTLSSGAAYVWVTVRGR